LPLRVGERLLRLQGIVDDDDIRAPSGQHAAGGSREPIALAGGNKCLWIGTSGASVTTRADKVSGGARTGFNPFAVLASEKYGKRPSDSAIVLMVGARHAGVVSLRHPRPPEHGQSVPRAAQPIGERPCRRKATLPNSAKTRCPEMH
jgi:hypothetical protein